MDGALFARPSSNLRFIVIICLSRIVRSTCFVSTSAGLATPGTFRSWKSPLLIRSCTHKSAVARWRIFPNPRRRQIPIAAAASVSTDNDQLSPRSCATACSPESLCGSLTYACKFCLGGTQCDGALRSRPVFDQMASMHHGSTRRRPTSSMAAAIICVDEGITPVTAGLHWIEPHQPRLAHKKAH